MQKNNVTLISKFYCDADFSVLVVFVVVVVVIVISFVVIVYYHHMMLDYVTD